MKHLSPIMLALTVSAGLMLVACRQINFHQLAAIYAHARIIFLLPIILTVIAELVLRALKWQLLLAPAGRVKVWDTFRLETAALALNNVLPLRLGEIVRGTYAADCFSMPLTTVLASIVAEKILDVVALLALTAISANSALPNLNPTCLPVCITIVLIIGVGYALFFRSGRLKDYPRLAMAVDNVALGFASMGNRKTVANLFLLALTQWLFNSLGYYFIAQSLGLGTHIGLVRSMAMAVTGATASSIPGMPGYFGNVEFAITGLMKTWGIPIHMGFACATGAHVISYLVVTLLGMILLYDLGRSPLQVWRKFTCGGNKMEVVNVENSRTD